ncbi:MAG: SAM-dependent methyltransferase, partial [Anaerolineae bacterium]|nr:SAM-dependent methyltransferase [Anaerolineae bacterium]
MPQITIVGLGPGDAGDLTRDAWQVLQEAGEVWLRTLHHPVVADLPVGLTLHAFDDVYERADRFSEVYGEIVGQILRLGRREQGVVYAVPGHPLVGESTVTRLLAVAREEGVMVRIVGGLSFVEPALTALELDALDGLQIIDALNLVTLNHPPLNPDQPALIAQVYSRAVASAVKLVLMNQYADEHPTVLID